MPKRPRTRSGESDLEKSLRAAVESHLAEGHSVNSLAKAAGVSHAQIVRFLSRERELRLAAVGRIAAALGLRLK